MIRLGLLRHGHTAWNRAGRIQGRSDIPLDDQAKRDLSTLSLPADWRNAEIQSSPLSRAAETAQLVCGRSPDTQPELIEMDWGKWEGLRGTDLGAEPENGFRPIESWGWSYCPHGGETPQDVWNRLLPWLNSIRSDTIAVCHIGIMRVLLARAHRWDFEGPAPFRIKRNRLYVISVSDGQIAPVAEPVRLIQKNGAV